MSSFKPNKLQKLSILWLFVVLLNIGLNSKVVKETFSKVGQTQPFTVLAICLDASLDEKSDSETFFKTTHLQSFTVQSNSDFTKSEVPTPLCVGLLARIKCGRTNLRSLFNQSIKLSRAPPKIKS